LPVRREKGFWDKKKKRVYHSWPKGGGGMGTAVQKLPRIQYEEWGDKEDSGERRLPSLDKSDQTFPVGKNN